MTKRGKPIVAHAQRNQDWASPMPTHGIANLHRVAPQVLRSAQPLVKSADALRALGVNTIVSLRAFNADDHFREGEFRLVRIPINTWAVRDEHVVRALAAIRLAERDGTVLIHCLHGADRTGVVVALYRMVVQGWSKASAREEMLQGGFGYHAIWRNIPKYLDRVSPESIAHRTAIALVEREMRGALAAR